MQHLLLLHGAIGSKEQLQPLAELLKNDFTIHALNFSGHGGEQMPEKFSMDVFKDDIVRYIEKQNIERINIFGYSMGGYVALYLAKHHPEKVNKIFTLATKFLWTSEIAQREIKMLDAIKIAEKIPAFGETLEKRHYPNDWKIVLQKTVDMMNTLGNNNPLTQNDFETIENAVLMGIGDRDNMITLEETIAVYRKLKNTSLIVLPNTSHPIEKMDIERLSREIKIFFGNADK
jgi:esterase/lipase